MLICVFCVGAMCVLLGQGQSTPSETPEKSSYNTFRCTIMKLPTMRFVHEMIMNEINEIATDM